MAQRNESAIKSIPLNFSFPGVDAHSHFYHCVAPLFIVQINLRLYCCPQSISGSMKSRAESITNHLKHITIVGLDGFLQNLVMARIWDRHRFGMSLPKPGAAFDIGIEKSHSARRG